MDEIEVERYADNGEYSHSEIIDAGTGKFVCFVCPICGGRWEKEDEQCFNEHVCCGSDYDSYSYADLKDW